MRTPRAKTARELLEDLRARHRGTRKGRSLERLTLASVLAEIQAREPRARRRRVLGGVR